MDRSGSMFLGLDVSTTAAKALVIDDANRIVSRGYHAFQPLASSVIGRAEQQASDIRA